MNIYDPEHILGMENRLREAEKKIQAVRHVVDTGTIAAPVLTEHDKGYNLALQHVKEALDGDNDE